MCWHLPTLILISPGLGVLLATGLGQKKPGLGAWLEGFGVHLDQRVWGIPDLRGWGVSGLDLEHLPYRCQVLSFIPDESENLAPLS